MGERRGTKALELWCRRITDGYPGVNVQNMTTSWRDGLAFCAMIHHFRPDLIDFNSLNKDDVYRNNELAFRTAEQHLGIPALLDAEDMASCTVPDRLSILTYLSQFYQTFGGSSPSRLATNRTTESSEERIAPVPESPKQKVGSRLGMRRDPCAACGLPVFLAEKLLIARTPYHRTCFRCARCGNQLTPGNYYETEQDQYCCETCPDEEEESVSVCRKYDDSIVSGAASEKSEPPKSLSDEEKTERKAAQSLLEKKATAVPDLISHTSQMRKSFMASHLLSGKIDQSIAKAVAPSANTMSTKASRTNSAFPDDDENEEQEEDEDEVDSRSSATDSPDAEMSHVERCDDVHSALNSLDISRNDEGQQSTAISFHDVDKSRVEDTKESPGRANSKASLSLVQKRLQMFEARDRRDHVDKGHRAENSAFQLTETERGAVVATTIASDSRDFVQLDVLRENDEETRSEKTLEEGSRAKSEKEESLVNVESANLELRRESSSDDVRIHNDKYLDERQQLEDNSSTVPSFDSRRESFVSIENKRNENDEMETFETATESNLLVTEDYPEDLNPFKSDEEDSVAENKQRTVTNSFKFNDKKVSTNPFDSDEDAEEVEPPKPAARSKSESRIVASPVKRLLAAPQINLNPFWSDEEEERDSDLEVRDRTSQGSAPVPKPRTIKTAPETNVAPRRADLSRGDVYASNTSIASSESAATTGGTYKKKKPAPQPPTAKELSSSDQYMSPVKSCNGTSSLYQNSSPKTTPRARKAKPAPPPPLPSSTPYNVPSNALNFDESSIIELHDASDDCSVVEMMWQDQKTNKDEMNRNRQSLNSVSDDYSYKSYTDKSAHGKWKRKKGPAPPRPIPHRRKIKVISMKDVKLELDEIELQQQGLERQGVRLEQLIRDKSESRPRMEDSPLGTDVEELVLELFALVNEKNELFRRQAELMLLRRQQRLEEEHAEVEYQIRCLMCQPEATKTDFDKQREEALIQRLVEIVERRNEIVECLEMDRRREVEEDKSINKHMGLFAARNKNELSSNDNDSSNITKTGKKGKTKEKLKEKKSKKVSKKDADKDVDETEMKHKRHNKRKWF